MVRPFSLGLLIVAATMCCGLASCAPAPQIMARVNKRPEASPPPHAHEDAAATAARSERSTSLSHITGTARKIQMFIKNHHLQLLPDGTVNGTLEDNSVYTILQRTTVGVGQMKIQGVNTCQYLCMDACGLLYGTREFNDECVFSEMIEQHHYNTYSSTKYSNDKRTMYLALNRRGQSRKVLLRAHQPLGRLSSYTRVLTRTVSAELAEELHPMRHHAHLCSGASTSAGDHHASMSPGKTGDGGEPVSRCRRRKKRKKRKRKCNSSSGDGEPADQAAAGTTAAESEMCQKRLQAHFARKPMSRVGTDNNGNNNAIIADNSRYYNATGNGFDRNITSSSSISGDGNSNLTKKCESDEDEQCQRFVFEVTTNSKKRLLKGKLHSDKLLLGGALPKKKAGFHKKRLPKSTEVPPTPPVVTVTVAEEPSLLDDDYTIDSTTTSGTWAEWEDSTMMLPMPPPDDSAPNLD